MLVCPKPHARQCKLWEPVTLPNVTSLFLIVTENFIKGKKLAVQIKDGEVTRAHAAQEEGQHIERHGHEEGVQGELSWFCA